MNDQRYWCDPQLPFVESRRASHSRACYVPHTHETLSIGAVDSGHSNYACGGDRARLGPGSLVLIPAMRVHSCNPDAQSEWSYQMLHLDVAWASAVLRENGSADADTVLACPSINQNREAYLRYCALNRLLFSKADSGEKEAALILFVGERSWLGEARDLPLDFLLLGDQRLAAGLVGGAVGNLAEGAAQFLGEGDAAAHLFLDQAVELRLDVALVRGQRLAVGLGAGTVAQAIDRAAHLDREFGEARQQVLLGAHRLGKRGEAVDQVGIRAGGGLPAFLDALQGARQPVETFGIALEQGLDVGGNAAADGLRRHRGNAGRARQPLLEFGVEAALRLTRLQFQEAQHQRARKAEQ